MIGKSILKLKMNHFIDMRVYWDKW